MKHLLLALCLIVAVVGISISKPQSTQPSQQVWEYKFDYKCNEQKATGYGAEGWELVAIGEGSVATHCVFKRLK